MLVLDILRHLNHPLARTIDPRVRRHPTTGALPCYRVRIPPEDLDLMVGMKLKSRYFLLSVLGKGGMSLVYKAKDLDSNAAVAIKSLRTQGLADEMLVKRFKREAEVLNRLNHPRIVEVYDYGMTSRGQPFFVMDYLIGRSLNQVLRQDGPLPPERFQDIFVQVAAAIAHAHKHGAIHRDLKPGNIMLVHKAGTSDYVKIVDFGIAKLAEEAQKLTRLGEVWGSPIYMSPEQGMGTTIDARTDIYSLGIVMYEALTGEVPFLGRNYVETMTKQISEPPVPPGQLKPELAIPETLEMIILKALEKAPESRYATMYEMKQDLEKALTDGSAAPEPTADAGILGFMRQSGFRDKKGGAPPSPTEELEGIESFIETDDSTGAEPASPPRSRSSRRRSAGTTGDRLPSRGRRKRSRSGELSRSTASTGTRSGRRSRSRLEALAERRDDSSDWRRAAMIMTVALIVVLVVVSNPQAQSLAVRLIEALQPNSATAP